MATVLGELPDSPRCLSEIERVLRPGELISISELRGDPDFHPLEVVGQLAEAEDLRFERSFGRSW